MDWMEKKVEKNRKNKQKANLIMRQQKEWNEDEKPERMKDYKKEREEEKKEIR